MLKENAIKKIRNRANKVGRNVDIKDDGRKVYVNFEDAVSEVSFYINSDGHISSPHVRRHNDVSDLMTDYFAGYHCDNLTQALNSVAPLPPKYSVGSLVRFKNSKRNIRQKLAGKIALVIQAETGGNYKVQYDGSENRWNPFYTERDLELVS